MGHVRNYTMGDVIARYRADAGPRSASPDGLGRVRMPAENAAMERKSIRASGRGQHRRDARSVKADWALRSTGRANWRPATRPIIGHEQALFLDLFDAGLVYRKESEVNWDPVDKTVLANEQVIDGRGWRSGAPVERRKLAQWFLKITEFAEDLRRA